MHFKDICKHLRDLLDHITRDLGKAEGGNKAAAQRVRTGTVRLEKIAKAYRKESIVEEKGRKSKKTGKHAVKASVKKAPAKKIVKKATVATKAKAKTHKTVVKAHHPLSVKRSTAKLKKRR